MEEEREEGREGMREREEGRKGGGMRGSGREGGSAREEEGEGMRERRKGTKGEGENGKGVFEYCIPMMITITQLSHDQCNILVFLHLSRGWGGMWDSNDGRHNAHLHCDAYVAPAARRGLHTPPPSQRKKERK